MARETLERSGMRVIGSKYRTRGGEIDLIALDGDAIAFVEVKTWPARYRLEDAALAVGPRKRARIAETAKHFLASHREYNESRVRFDVVYVRDGRTLKHARGAFEE